jgi:hypothetical protein
VHDQSKGINASLWAEAKTRRKLNGPHFRVRCDVANRPCCLKCSVDDTCEGHGDHMRRKKSFLELTIAGGVDDRLSVILIETDFLCIKSL